MTAPNIPADVKERVAREMAGLQQQFRVDSEKTFASLGQGAEVKAALQNLQTQGTSEYMHNGQDTVISGAGTDDVRVQQALMHPSLLGELFAQFSIGKAKGGFARG